MGRDGDHDHHHDDDSDGPRGADVISPHSDSDEDSGGLTSTVWRQSAELPVDARPHIALHYSVQQNQLQEDAATDPVQLTYEDSRLYQQDDDEEEEQDPDRPSSTVFRGDSASPRGAQGFFRENDQNQNDGNSARRPRNLQGQRSLSVGVGGQFDGDSDDDAEYEDVEEHDDDGNGHHHHYDDDVVDDDHRDEDEDGYSFEEDETESSSYVDTE